MVERQSRLEKSRKNDLIPESKKPLSVALFFKPRLANSVQK
ncbi:hypothetical protein VDG1235_1859 [Verrucomicrobiia bacterium DG1235]|nr:hypothetical protein VDG1235_1859 [Verrucomicrobiae bacterium DG1235]